MRIDGQRILAVSPHPDDAVLGMGAALSAASQPIVVTVFAGDPGADTPASSWDQRLGPTAADAAAVRRREDVAALGVVGASAVQLGFLEASYRSRSRCHEIYEGIDIFNLLRHDLVRVLESSQPEILVVPLGLGHVDHRLAAAAAISAWITDRTCELWTYAEQPYAEHDPALTRRRLRDLRAAAVPMIAMDDPQHAAARREAVLTYRSQLSALQRVFVGWEPGERTTELLWRLEFNPALGVVVPEMPVAVPHFVT